MIKLQGLNKTFTNRKILDGLDLDIQDGEFLAVIGRSGEGKSVLLKHIIGLLKPDSGNVIIDGVDITKLEGDKLQEIYKKCGYVFQFAALLDSLSVVENVGITLLENGESMKKVRPLVAKKLQDVGLRPDVIDKYPNELSGGMRKRVGLARTLMLSPKIILYDEPTTGLDPISVRRIHELIAQTHEKHKATTIVISHDPDVFTYATKVAMLHNGKILYTGDARTIWDCKDEYVHQFIRGLAQGPITDESAKK